MKQKTYNRDDLEKLSWETLLLVYQEVFGEQMPNQMDLTTAEDMKEAAIQAIVSGKPRKQWFTNDVVLGSTKNI